MLGCHKPVIPMVSFTTPLTWNYQVQKDRYRPRFRGLYSYWKSKSSKLLPFCSARGFRPRWGRLTLWQIYCPIEVFGLWFLWVRLQSCFANCESESNPDPVPNRFQQSDSCLSPGIYKSSKQTVRFSSVKTKSKSNPDPATGNKTSLLMLLEATGVQIQKVQNPVHAHRCCPSQTPRLTRSSERLARRPKPAALRARTMARRPFFSLLNK